MFEILTLKQTGKTTPIPIILFDEAYWNSILNFERLVQEGTITEDDPRLFEFASDPEDAWTRLSPMVLHSTQPSRQEAT